MRGLDSGECARCDKASDLKRFYGQVPLVWGSFRATYPWKWCDGSRLAETIFAEHTVLWIGWL